MTRLLATIKTDVTVQFRNQLYAIGIGSAPLSAWLCPSSPSQRYCPQLSRF